MTPQKPKPQDNRKKSKPTRAYGRRPAHRRESRPIRNGQTESGATTTLTQSAPNELKIIPLGGLEEVGRNMTLFEYNNKVLIVDVGLQFPEEDMHGIDYIIPNTSYLN